jgi:hypothetical protein
MTSLKYRWGLWLFTTDAPRSYVLKIGKVHRGIFFTRHSPDFHRAIIKTLFEMKGYKFVALEYDNKKEGIEL